MRYIEPPHQILRKCLIEGKRFESTAHHLSSFMASTLLGTSGIVLTADILRMKVSQWSRNTGMCAITEQVVFTDPFKIAKYNRWTSPYLDDYAAAIRDDMPLKLAASVLKTKFLTCTQALVHGDLHTGSVMVKEGSTFCIDPEFAYYGPMGFDVGALLANYLLSYFSQAGSNGEEFSEWILSQTALLFSSFEEKFLALWNQAASEGKFGELYPTEVFPPGPVLRQAQLKFLADLWTDTLGFAGMKMIRRIVGIAHVADLESIQDLAVRSTCEKRALIMGRKLVLASSFSLSAGEVSNDKIVGYRQSLPIPSIHHVIETARSLYHSEPPSTWVL
jgi:5-methylthioribose kinase